MAVSFTSPRGISVCKWFCCLAITLSAVSARAPHAAALQASGTFTEFPLPNPNSGPTTVSIAPDGTLWFTESSGNRIGRMAQDGTGLVEFDLPHPGSAPRIITIGADGNFWFSEHLGNRMGRITKDGTISEFDIGREDRRVPDSKRDGFADQHRCRSRSQYLVHESREARSCDVGRRHHRVRHPTWRRTDRTLSRKRSLSADAADRQVVVHGWKQTGLSGIPITGGFDVCRPRVVCNARLVAGVV
jgi:hypothetical protein